MLMPFRGLYTPRIVCVVLVIGLLAGCGGGGELDVVAPGELDSHNYVRSAYQSPNYHPHVTGSHVYTWGNTVYIGGDLEPREELRQVATENENGIRYFMGASRDGVGVNRIRNYEDDLRTRDGSIFSLLSSDGFYPFRVKPRARLGRGFEDLDTETTAALLESIQILNDALPPEFQIETAGGYYGGPIYEGDIVVAALPPAEIQEQCSRDAVACAFNTIPFLRNYTESAILLIPDVRYHAIHVSPYGHHP